MSGWDWTLIAADLGMIVCVATGVLDRIQWPNGSNDFRLIGKRSLKGELPILWSAMKIVLVLMAIGHILGIASPTSYGWRIAVTVSLDTVFITGVVRQLIYSHRKEQNIRDRYNKRGDNSSEGQIL